MSNRIHRDFMLTDDNSSKMRLVSDRLRWWNRLSILLLVAGSMVVFPSRAFAAHDRGTGSRDGGPEGTPGNHGRRDPTQFSGTFVISVRGFFTSDPGQSANTASVTSASVSLHAQVKDDAGNTYAFDAQNLRINDSYHFSGTGTIGSTQVSIDGHVDPSDPNNTNGNGHGQGHGRQVVSQGRLECTYTFTTSSGERHAGRVVGVRQSS